MVLSKIDKSTRWARIAALLLFLSSGCAARQSENLHCASAHRGDHTKSPENSLAAIRAATLLNLPFIEIDIRASVDGELFLFHDRAVREQNAVAEPQLYGREFSSLTTSQIKSLQLHNSKEPPPTLQEALREVEHTSSYLQLDLKLSSAEDLLKVGRVVAATPTAKRSVVMCYDTECSDLISRAFPELKILLRAKDISAAADYLRKEPYILQVDPEDVIPSVVSEAARRKTLLLVKSLGPEDDLQNWRKLFAEGANIILTDQPREIQQLLNCPVEQLE